MTGLDPVAPPLTHARSAILELGIQTECGTTVATCVLLPDRLCSSLAGDAQIVVTFPEAAQPIDINDRTNQSSDAQIWMGRAHTSASITEMERVLAQGDLKGNHLPIAHIANRLVNSSIMAGDQES